MSFTAVLLYCRTFKVQYCQSGPACLRLGKPNACPSALEEQLYVSTRQSHFSSFHFYFLCFHFLSLTHSILGRLWRSSYTFPLVKVSANLINARILRAYIMGTLPQVDEIGITHNNNDNDNNKQGTAQSWARLSKMKSASLMMKQQSQVAM